MEIETERIGSIWFRYSTNSMNEKTGSVNLCWENWCSEETGTPLLPPPTKKKSMLYVRELVHINNLKSAVSIRKKLVPTTGPTAGVVQTGTVKTTRPIKPTGAVNRHNQN